MHSRRTRSIAEWSFVYRDFLSRHIAILMPMMFFLGVLVLGLIYEVRKGALEWEK